MVAELAELGVRAEPLPGDGHIAVKVGTDVYVALEPIEDEEDAAWWAACVAARARGVQA